LGYDKKLLISITVPAPLSWALGGSGQNRQETTGFQHFFYLDFKSERSPLLNKHLPVMILIFLLIKTDNPMCVLF